MIRTMAVLGLISLTAGCSAEWAPLDWEGGWSTYGGDQLIESARLNGELGRFSAQDESGWGTSYNGDWGFTLDIRGETDGVIMGLVDVSNLSLSDLNPGDVLRSTPRGGTTINGEANTDVWVNMIACAGRNDGNWQEDVGAEDVEVVVTEQTEDGTTIEFTGTLPRGETVSAGGIVPAEL